MKISTTIFPQYALRHQTRGAVQKSSFSKAAAIFLRGAYGEYVSTEKWRERR